MHYSEKSEETLVMLTLAGDADAYEELVKRYQTQVLIAANSVLHNTYLAEDAAQDAFVSAWIKLNLLREPSKFGTWVCRIAKNCARDMLYRFQDYISFDLLENADYSDSEALDGALIFSEEYRELHEGVNRLPERTRKIILLHYFDGLNIAQIAAQMRIPQGTVKWQLHEGRQKLRKELGAMDEKMNDTLVKKVMKKVDELKLWRLKQNKDGFEAVYREVLKDVEAMPESSEKAHALADVLMHGWWWVPGEKNNALLARIKQASIDGHHEEMMKVIIDLEDVKVTGNKNRIEFIRETQIPYLEKLGFSYALGCEWSSLAYCYNRVGDSENAAVAYRKAHEILKPNQLGYAYSISCEMIEKFPITWKNHHRHHMGAAAYHLQKINGSLRLVNKSGHTDGKLYDMDHTPNDIISNAGRCDGHFTISDGKIDDSIIGSAGQVLTFEGDNITVETPCETFTECQCYRLQTETMLYRTYYKDGVGIVKQEKYHQNRMEVRWLKKYTIVGGDGLFPCCTGNRWEYTADFDKKYIGYESHLEMVYADETDMMLSFRYHTERLAFNENDWRDMHAQMRNEYYIKDEAMKAKLGDVSYAMKRVEELADTPYRKAYTKAANSTMRRIYATHSSNEQRTQSGHWNFFSPQSVCEQDGDVRFGGEPFMYSFESKNTGNEVLHGAGYGILFNDIYGILNQMAQALWSDKWVPGACYTVTQIYRDCPVTATISCRMSEQRIATKAGQFENCLELTVDAQGCGKGVEYRGGKKEYTFAPQIGLVRIVNHYGDGLKTIYELTDYTGTGKGYMPMQEDLWRRYDAIDLSDGFVAWAEYFYERNESGVLTIISDRGGVKNIR